MAAIDRWWNDDWGYRNLLETVPNGSAHSSGVHFLRCDVNLTQLVSDGKVRSDYSDIRIICQKSDHIINIPYYIASGCSPQRIFFTAQHDIPVNSNIASLGLSQYYYIYYNNEISYDTNIPNDYININFPQAPYSCHPDGYDTQYGKYRDKVLFRLNDNPSDGPVGFLDSAGHSNGISRHHQKVQKGHSGILDQSVFFDGDYIDYVTSSGSWIEIPEDNSYQWLNPSGSWAVDFWLKVHPKTGGHYGTPFYHPAGYSTEYDEAFPYLNYYFNNTKTAVYTYNNFSSRKELFQAIQPSKQFASGIWTHIRAAYRTGGGHLYSRIYMWVNGSGASLYRHAQSDDSQAYAEDTAFLTNIQNAPAFIGYHYRIDNSDTYMLTGWLEQLRYSTFIYTAISGTADPADPYMCAPDWIDQQYIATPGTLEAAAIASGDIGGIILVQEGGSTSGFIGGTTLSRCFNSQSIGGLSWILSAPTSESIGGFLLCLVRTSGAIGGMARVSMGDIDIHSIENLNRVLIKANSHEVNKQSFGMDSLLTLNGIAYGEFDSKLSVQFNSIEEFDALLNINKLHKNPHVEIIDSTSNYNGYLPCNYTITASGYAFNKNNIAYNSGIHNVIFIWGDNDYTIVTNPITSGNIWKATHTYAHSGLYAPVVVVKDGYGRTGSNTISLNLASGVNHPYIMLSGWPRSGSTPPPLTVDFNYSLSGILGSRTIYWDFCNGITYFNNAVNQIGHYALPGDYTPFVRIEDSRGIYVVDTLRVGFNN